MTFWGHFEPHFFLIQYKNKVIFQFVQCNLDTREVVTGSCILIRCSEIAIFFPFGESFLDYCPALWHPLFMAFSSFSLTNQIPLQSYYMHFTWGWGETGNNTQMLKYFFSESVFKIIFWCLSFLFITIFCQSDTYPLVSDWLSPFFLSIFLYHYPISFLSLYWIHFIAIQLFIRVLACLILCYFSAAITRFSRKVQKQRNHQSYGSSINMCCERVTCYLHVHPHTYLFLDCHFLDSCFSLTY